MVEEIKNYYKEFWTLWKLSVDFLNQLQKRIAEKGQWETKVVKVKQLSHYSAAES